MMCKQLFCLACLFIVLGAAGNSSAQILVHYKLDEVSGNIAVDSSGKGNDGIIGAEPNWVEGWIEGALQFGENDANSITLPAERMGLRSDTGTVAFWVNMTEVAGGINTIWWGGDNTLGGGFGPENEMHIMVETVVANIWTGGEFGFYFRGDPNNVHLHSDPNKGDAPGVEPVTPILLPDEQWHHITGTWGNEDGNAKLYYDGQLLHEISYGWTNISYPLTNIYIGQMANGGRVFTGLLDEVQIYGGALTADEIQIVMGGGEILNLKAALPEPANQGTEVPRDTILGWMASDRADTHNVYFGDNFDDVNEAGVDDPRGVLVGENLADNT
ncbi:MAG: LamG domain-containing protein, partial [Planctomycetota bacterium]